MSATVARWFTRSVRSAGRIALAVAAPLVVAGLAVGLAKEGSRRPLDAPAARGEAAVAARPDGKELFTREWLPRDARAHGGDGLGPVFNDSSCVARHNLGGVGGGGPKAKNVTIVTPFGGGTPNGVPPHPIGPSFVLHRHSTDEDFVKWRAQQESGLGKFPVFANQGQDATLHRALSFSVLNGGGNRLTQRQTTALFGAGAIDAIPDRVLEEAEARKFADFPEVTGRVSPLEKGGIGRFGWKAQVGRLEEFVLTACAVELGLQVPGKEQPPLPHKKDYKAPGLDMNEAECASLVKFIRDLPAPPEQRPAATAAAKYVSGGKELFATVGCATCHTPKLGDAEGIYSDLLLHDMGEQLSDAGSSYGVFRPTPNPVTNPKPAEPKPEEPKPAEIVKSKSGALPAAARLAAPAEWRTPPLWGVRDSAPYLHDGRAETLEDAIAHHGGEAQRSQTKFAALKFEERQQLVAFLKTLVAPEPK
jgi:CxxC motif-containing protein (DUF1111 family)